ncbi:hypothetical protein [Chryseolinea lacunae]|uniref:Glycosyltransferase RgtA/B/C/D-like domain-containing protein n=1 Tax=Chryseolinea lacunae TaxID=2801331 RepID=A0ABS1KNI3_9BACT|nr:hypothetical protein [Chryseolinea lacunae]MBL0740900.1 hypothetical protein [Chryseolinea lacunae]
MKIFFAIINVGFLFAVAFQLWKKEPATLRPLFWPALLFKCAAGLGLGWLYAHYYGLGDTLLYFHDGARLAQLARLDPVTYLLFLWNGDESFPFWSNLHLQEPRALFMAKITSVFNLFSHDDYWITSLYFSIIPFFSAWMLTKAIVRLDATLRGAAVFSLLFFPSAVFWGTGLIKESLAMSSLFFISVVFLKLWRNERVSAVQWIACLPALWLVWGLKYYYLAIFLPVAASTLVARFVFSRLPAINTGVKVALWAVIFLVPLLAASLFHPNFYPERFLEVIVSNYDVFHEISQPEDVVTYAGLEATASSVLAHAPGALLTGLFRPFPWEAGNVLQGFASLENMVLLVLSVAALWNVKKLVASPQRMLLWSLFLYSVLLCVFLALSTPNFGTLSRYRVGFLPFYVLLISIENPVLRYAFNFLERSWNRLVR